MRLKTLFSFLMIAFVAVSCKKDDAENETTKTKVHEDFKDYDLNASVQSILITTKVATTSKTDTTSFKTSHKEQVFFNEKGQLIQKKILSEDGSIYEDHYYKGKDELIKTIKYSNGQVFETILVKRNAKNKIYSITKTDATNQIQEVEKFEYQNGLLFRKLRFDRQKTEVEKIVYEYTPAQLLEKESIYGTSNQLKIVKKYIYDDNKNLIEIKDINHKNEVVLTTKNTYDGKNELLVTDYFNKKNEKIRSEKKKHDADGRLINFVVVDETGKQIATETQYNEAGKMSSYAQLEDNVLTESMNYSYDNNGFLIETLDNIERNSPLNSQFEYEIDDKKNWTKKTLLIKNTPLEIVERTIVYF